MGFARIWARTVGAPMAARVGPVWIGVMIVAAIIFGPTGMHPGDLTSSALGSPRVLAGLWAIWLVLLAPGGRALLDRRPTTWLRTLPAPRWWRRAVVAALAVAAQAPWVALWAAGEGAVAGVAVAAAGALGMLLIGFAAGHIAPRRSVPRWRSPLAALIGVHARSLVRTRGAALVRGAGMALLGGLAAGLVARANGLVGSSQATAAVAVTALGLAIAIGALAAPLVEGERALGWLLASTATTRPLRLAATATVMLGAGALLGALAGVACAWLAGADLADAGRTTAAVTVAGAWLGAAALRAGRWALLAEGGDGTRVVVAMLGAAIATMVVVGVLGALGLVLLAVGGFALTAAQASRRP